MEKESKNSMSKLKVGVTFLVITVVMLLLVLTFLTVLFLGISDRAENWWYVASKITEHPAYWLASMLIALTAFGSWLADKKH